MFPKINPKQMEAMMKRMGIKQVTIPANEVVIRCNDRIIKIIEPSVTKINMIGEETFQISGRIEESELDSTPEISEDDINTIVEQTGVKPELAREALIRNKGDLAKTILELSDSE